MLNVIIITIAVALGGYLALSKRLAGSSNWKATVTPLASIMGSGFLVSAPVLPEYSIRGRLGLTRSETPVPTGILGSSRLRR